MSNPEELESNEEEAASEVELTLMRSDLAEVFKTHSDKVAVYQTENFDEPARVVLAGSFENETASGYIQVWQRSENKQNNYLVTFDTGGDSYWYLISATQANSVWEGRPAMGKNDVDWVRRYLGPAVVDWDPESALQAAKYFDPFDRADEYE